MRLNLNPAAGCGSQIEAGLTHRPVALDLTEATEGLEALGESQTWFFLGQENQPKLRPSSDSFGRGHRLGTGPHRNRKRVNDRARVGCASRHLTTQR